MEHTRNVTRPEPPLDRRRPAASPQAALALRRLLAGAVAGTAWLLLSWTAAEAVEPVRLDSAYVTDVAEVLSEADEAAADERLAAAYSETGIDLYVVLVDDFTDPADRIDWANETADLNGLGESQYLLAVSTEGRQYFISGLDSGPLSDGQLEDIETRILPELRASDWLGAIEAAAEQLEEERAAPGRTAAVVIGVGAGVVGIGGATAGIVAATRRGRARRASAEELAQLEQVSGAGLVAADDAVRTSAQELDFARAQFGDGAVAEFAAALDSAQAQLLEAFRLRQQLDDAVPDTDAQRREWLQQIIALCGAVDAGLDAQAAAFDELRAIEQNAPAALAALTERRQRVSAAGAAAAAELARLASVYAADELAALADGPQQAASLLAFAQERESAAQRALSGEAAAPGTGSGAGAAAVAIREAEAAVAQAEALHQMVAAHGAELADVEARCAALIAELENDVAGARAMADPDGSIAAAAQLAEQQVAQARAGLAASGRRPSAALQALAAANARIDGVVHTAQETARARQLLEASLVQTAEQVRQAESYIDARRGAIGSVARTRAAEARAALSRGEAARDADPRTALADVQRAAQLAAQALAEAQADVSGFGTGGSGGGSDVGAVLGGIFGYGGGGSYGGYGGSGSSWGGSGRSGGSSSRRSSGSSRRSSGSRSSSSRSSGGSRRSRGGGRF